MSATPLWTIAAVARALGLSGKFPETAIDFVTQDSRLVKPGSLFVALSGTPSGGFFSSFASARDGWEFAANAEAAVASNTSAVRSASESENAALAIAAMLKKPAAGGIPTSARMPMANAPAVQRILEPNAGLLNTFLRSVGLDAGDGQQKTAGK